MARLTPPARSRTTKTKTSSTTKHPIVGANHKSPEKLWDPAEACMNRHPLVMYRDVGAPTVSIPMTADVESATNHRQCRMHNACNTHNREVEVDRASQQTAVRLMVEPKNHLRGRLLPKGQINLVRIF